MKVNKRVRAMVADDLQPGEEALAVIRLLRSAEEGRATYSGAMSSSNADAGEEALLLSRHGLDAGTVLGQGDGERRDLIGCWLTVTPERLLWHAPDTGFWVVRPKPAELRLTMDRSELTSVEYADIRGRAIVFRCWLFRFADGTWSLQHTMIGGTIQKKAFDDEGILAAEALGATEVSAPA